MEYNDDKLIYYIHLHNKTAYQILCDKYLRLTKIILRKNIDYSIIDRDDYNDMIQECLVLLNRAIYSYRTEEGTFYMYFRQAIYNVLYNHLRLMNNLKNKVIFEYQEEDNDANLFLTLKDSFDIKENYCINEERKYVVSQCKNELESNVIYLKQEGYSYKEIATLLGIRVKRVDYILSNIKKKSKKIYD